jgi:hypothetical protein
MFVFTTLSDYLDWKCQMRIDLYSRADAQRDQLNCRDSVATISSSGNIPVR